MNLKDTNKFFKFHLAYNSTGMSCGFKVQLSGCHLIYPTQNFLFSPVLNSEQQQIGISVTCYTRVYFYNLWFCVPYQQFLKNKCIFFWDQFWIKEFFPYSFRFFKMNSSEGQMEPASFCCSS